MPTESEIAKGIADEQCKLEGAPATTEFPGSTPAAVPTPEKVEEEIHWMYTLGTDPESPDAPVKEEE